MLVQKTISVCLFMLALGILNAQSTFRLNITNEKNEIFVKAAEDYQHNYLLFGHSLSFNTLEKRDLYLVKTNSIGDIKWSKSYVCPGIEDGVDLIVDFDGNYVMLGVEMPDTTNYYSNIIIIKTDTSGEILWSKRIGGPYNDVGNQIKQLPDSSYVICGYTEENYPTSSRAYLVKIQKNGSLQSAKIYTNSGHDMMDMHVYPNGDLLIFARPSQGTGQVFFRVSNSGVIIDAKKIGTASRFSMEIDSMGNIYTLSGSGNPAHASVVKLDSNLNFVWQKSFSEQYLSGSDGIYFDDLILNSEETYLLVSGHLEGISASSTSSIVGGSFVLKFDLDGNVLEKKLRTDQYSGSDARQWVKLGKTADGAYLLVGKKTKLTYTSALDMYDGLVVKFKDGVGQPQCFGSIQLNTESYNNSSLLTVNTTNYSYENISNLELTATSVNSSSVKECFNCVNPESNFNYTMLSLNGDFHFSNSTLFGENAKWHFGDGNSSSQWNTGHTYLNPGTYQVKLVVSNPCGKDSMTQEVTVCFTPFASFEFEVVPDTFPLVYFQNSSEYADSYKWYFGDGDSSTLMNPSHIYPASGMYEVTLIVSNFCGSDTLMFSIFACSAVTADMSYSSNGVDTFFFFNNSNNFDTLTWKFGDGNSSNSLNPVHIYQIPGFYVVTLTALNTCDTDSISTFIAVQPVGLGSEPFLVEVGVYPNPSQGTIIVQNPSLDCKQRIGIIRDLTGRKLRSVELNSEETTIRLSEPTGFYILEIRSVDQQFESSVMLQIIK